MTKEGGGAGLSVWCVEELSGGEVRRGGRRSELDAHIVLFGQAAEVDDGVAHSSEGGVDAHAGACGDVFEVAFAVVAEDDDAALLGGEHFDELADVAAGLLAHDALLDVVIVEREGLNHIMVGTVGHDGHLVCAAVHIEDVVAGDAHDPMDEFVFIAVGSIVDGCDHFEEGILENIVGNIFVFHYGKYIAIHLGLIAGKEQVKTFDVTIHIALYQLVVGERAN